LRSQDQTQYTHAAQALARGEIDAAGLSDEDRLMLNYAKKLNDTPAEMTDADTQQLRDAGFTDEQVWEATFTVSIFNMFNRMADAFGLEAPENMVTALGRPPANG
jgi:uncharacterized peroxidase-related enzyme